MGGSSFDSIVQEIINQQHIMEQMEEENRELRRQLADLRDGRGIFVDIGGQRFALVATMQSYQSYGEEMTEVVAVVGAAGMAVEVATQVDVEPIEVEAEQESAIEAEESAEGSLYDYESSEEESADAPTQALPEIVDQPTQTERETPVPPVSAESFLLDDEEPMPSFLEELMVDEFVTATRNHKAIWSAPEAQQQKIELSDEEAKATLRRELMGSFLLD